MIINSPTNPIRDTNILKSKKNDVDRYYLIANIGFITAGVLGIAVIVEGIFTDWKDERSNIRKLITPMSAASGTSGVDMAWEW